MRQLTIAGTVINDQSAAFTIAELGHNHGGSVETCKAMIRAAADAGASAVKLQKRDNANLYTAAYANRPYTSENSYGATYLEHREALEFGVQDYFDLDMEASVFGVAFFATAFDQLSAGYLNALDMPAFKIASGDLTNTPLLKYVASFGRPMIVSTGAASQRDVDRAVEAIWPINQQLAILHCTATYPTRVEHLNLNVIKTYREEYPDLVIGLSSHYSGISDCIAAYVLGARIFEKHFTLDRTAKGTDHPFSLEPAGFAKLVTYLSAVREALGDGVKTCLDEERPALEKMGKSLYAARDLPARHVLAAKDIAIKSPGGGLPPYMLDVLLRKPLAVDVLADEPLSKDHLYLEIG